jgi:hypothetical protein
MRQADDLTQKRDCEKSRELCIQSCYKQRLTCDKNNPKDPDYCVNQDKRCQKGCEDAWKKCSSGETVGQTAGGCLTVPQI